MAEQKKVSSLHYHKERSVQPLHRRICPDIEDKMSLSCIILKLEDGESISRSAKVTTLEGQIWKEVLVGDIEYGATVSKLRIVFIT